MKPLILISTILFCISLSQAYVKHEQKGELNFYAFTNCLNEDVTPIMIEYLKAQDKHFTSNEKSAFNTYNEMLREDKEPFQEFSACFQKNFKSFEKQIQNYLIKNEVSANMNILYDALVANFEAVQEIKDKLEYNLRKNNFDEVEETLEKGSKQLVVWMHSFRNFDRKDTQFANFVNAFDNTILAFYKVNSLGGVDECYKSVEDYRKMFEFLDELAEGCDDVDIDDYLSSEGEELFDSLRKVNKCKSNTAAGQALTKAAGFDVFSNLIDKMEELDMKRLNKNFKIEPPSGTQFAWQINLMIRESK